MFAEMLAEEYERPPLALYVPAPVEERLVVVGPPLPQMRFALSSFGMPARSVAQHERGWSQL